MDLLEWFIRWVADNHSNFSLKERQELEMLIKRLKTEMQEWLNLKCFSSNEPEQKTSENTELDQSSEKIPSFEELHYKETYEMNFDSSYDENKSPVYATFLALVKLYLKDGKQISSPFQNISYQFTFKCNTDSSSDSRYQIDKSDSFDENQREDIDFEESGCSFSLDDANETEMGTSHEVSPTQTNQSTAIDDTKTRMLTEERIPISCMTVESSKKIEQVRQEVKLIADILITCDGSTNQNYLLHLDEKLTEYLLNLDAIECSGNKKLHFARKTLVEYIQELIARLETIPLLDAACNKRIPDFSDATISPLQRIEEVQKLAEKVESDMKFYMFDSCFDERFVHLDKKLMKCLNLLDQTECLEDETLHAAREKVVKFIDELSCRLEIKVLLDSFLTSNIEDSSVLFNRSKALLCIRDVKYLLKNVEHLISFYTCDHGTEQKFRNLDKLLIICSTQLANIECLGDELLLNEQQLAANFIKDLANRLENTLSSNIAAEGVETEQVSNGVGSDQVLSNVDTEQVLNNADTELGTNHFGVEQSSNGVSTEQYSLSQATKTSLLKRIEELKEDSERLKVHIEFGDFESRTDRNYLYVEEMLTNNLISLDGMCCGNSIPVRAARKKVIQFIQHLTAILEERVPV